MRHPKTRIAGLTAVASLTLAGCGAGEKEAFDWASQDLVLLTSTGTAGWFEQDQGHLWGATAGDKTESLTTSGLEAGQLLIVGDTLHFDDRDHSLELAAGSSELTSVDRDPEDYLTALVPMPESGGIFRLFNHGSMSLVVQQGADLESFPSDHVPLAAMHCEGQVYALGSSAGSDENAPSRSLALFEVPAAGPPVVAQQWDADDGGDFVGSMGCLEGQPRWVEEIYESEDSAASTEVVVGLDADGERIVTPITADGPRELETAIGQEQNDGQIACGGRSTSADGGLFESCLDGSIQRIDLHSGEVTVALDASGLAKSSDGYVDTYVSADGFVALATDDSSNITLGIYDRDGVEVERMVFEGLATKTFKDSEGIYDFVAVNHPPLR